MIKNYLITILRNSLRQKAHALTNILGLTVGMASAILIFLWIHDEVNFDRFLDGGNQIFDVLENQTYQDNKIYTFAATPGLLAPALQDEFPEIESVCRMDWGQHLSFRYGDKLLTETGRYADSSLFKVFHFPIAYGNPANPIPDNTSLAISEKLAKKYFDTPAEAMGKVFRIDDTYDLKVTCVYHDIPENSSVNYDFFAPMSIFLEKNSWTQHWGSNGLRTYIKLYDPTKAPELSKKIADFIKKRNEGSVVTLFLQPFEQDHLYGNFENGKQAGGRITLIRLLGVVALMIIIVACINFMNLSTARALNRLKEVGLRKVIGATRRMLICQFTMESMILSVVSLGLALGVVHLLMPFFNELTGKHLTVDYSDPVFLGAVLGITVFTGLLAGSYPSLLLSSFRPASALKRNTGSLLTGERLRKSLVVIQFLVSVVLILTTITIYRQINFIRDTDLGMDRTNILKVPLGSNILKNRDAFRNDVVSLASVDNLSFTTESPVQVGSSTADLSWPGKDPDKFVLIQQIFVSQEFIKTMGITILEGRDFSPENKADSSNIIVNEEAVKRMGLKDPVGTDISDGDSKGKIIGVIKNFHSTNMHDPIEPLMLILHPEYSYMALIKIEPGQQKKAVADITSIYKKWDPNRPFDYQFLDDEFDQMYHSDDVLGRLAGSFTFIAIFISCLGLFGLASYAAEKRIKEIGIRKVLGASVNGLIIMLCSDFARLILISLVLGSALSYYITTKFLEQYAFHVSLDASYFIYASVVLLVIALATVIVQSARAALTNPVNTLRGE